MWSLIQSFSTHQVYEIAGLHRSFVKQANECVSYSTFYDQLAKPTFEDFLKAIYQKVQNQLYLDQSDKMPSVFAQFKDVQAHDGSSWAIDDELASVFPGRFNTHSPAAIEIHATYSLKYLCFHQLEIAPDTQSEHDFIPIGKEGVLYLLDRGLMNNPKLQVIEDNGGFFINRAKSNINPYIETVHGGSCTQKRLRENRRLKDRALKKGRDYDFKAWFKTNDGEWYCRRLLALYNPQKKAHNFFITNLSLEQVSAQEAGDLYRLRWQVELSFKELKSFSGLKRFQTGNTHIIRGFIMMSLIAMQIRRYLVLCAEQMNPKVRLSLHKAAISAAEFMPELVACMIQGGDNLKQTLFEIFCYLQAVMGFSNPKRETAFEKVNLGKPTLCLALVS